MKRITLASVLAATLLVSALLVAVTVVAAESTPGPLDQAKPEFKLGFKALADKIPTVAGQPTENEHWGANGDSLQQTTTGLMVWRKADNWTAFTDGSRTWINGPAGVQDRSNSERFDWENTGGQGMGAANDSYKDPFAYCAAVGTIDKPDSRYTGPQLPDSIKQAMMKILGATPDAFFDGNTPFRCMDNKVYACNVGANLNCWKADVSKEPTAEMKKFCQERPDSFMPAAVTGHSGIYEWQCVGTKPTITAQTFHPDKRGFVSELWYEIPKPK